MRSWTVLLALLTLAGCEREQGSLGPLIRPGNPDGWEDTSAPPEDDILPGWPSQPGSPTTETDVPTAPEDGGVPDDGDGGSPGGGTTGSTSGDAPDGGTGGTTGGWTPGEVVPLPLDTGLPDGGTPDGGTPDGGTPGGGTPGGGTSGGTTGTTSGGTTGSTGGGTTGGTSGTPPLDTDPEPPVDTGPPPVLTEHECEVASRIAGHLDQFQRPGDGKVVYCHRSADGKWVTIDTDISSCIPHTHHMRDIFPSSLCDS